LGAMKMRNCVIVEVPLHITSIWLPRYTDDALTTGSMGAGVVIRPGVRLRVTPNSGSRPDVEHVNAVLGRFGVGFSVTYESPVSLGVGYGMSAALTLGTALGAAALLGKSMLEAAKLAHVIEVEFRTGLGDVIAEYFGGGIELRLRPGPPGIGIIDRIPYSHDVKIVTVDMARGSTPAMLRDLADRLNEVGPRYIDALIKEPTYEKFLELSTGFSRDIGFLTNELESRIRACARYADSYYVKKGVLVFLTRNDETEQLLECLSKLGLRGRVFQLSNVGVEVILYNDR